MGRGARFAIGLPVVAVLVVAAGVLAATGMSGQDWSDGLTRQGQGTVLDVDRYAYDDGGPESGLTVDVRLDDGTARDVVTLDWPADEPTPRDGERVPVRYDPSDVEGSTVYDTDPDDLERHAADPAIPTMGTHAWAWWAALGCLLGAIVCSVATLVWALRVPRKPKRYVPLYPPSYVPPGYPAPNFPPGYPVPNFPPGYPAPYPPAAPPASRPSESGYHPPV